MLRTTLLATALLVAPGLALAQQATPPPVTAGAQANPAIKRTPLQMFDVAGTNQTTAIMRVDVIPNGQIGRHTHPGIESGYVLEGDMVLIVDGQPDRTLKAGESYQIPSGAIHDGKAGDKGAAVIATFVVEKGKPMAAPAAPK
jgi:quercetin dioxygenase-like cupin family protein